MVGGGWCLPFAVWDECAIAFCGWGWWVVGVNIGLHFIYYYHISC